LSAGSGLMSGSPQRLSWLPNPVPEFQVLAWTTY
jgi:hypothetical protein